MSFAFPGDASLDYFPCRYGRSKLLFRGPRRDLTAPYVAVLGSTETYGKFVPHPYPARLEAALGLPVVNLGVPSAGPDAWGQDATLLDIAAKARVTVVQVTGAQNLTNRFYAVHPRRNDRFLRASPLLTQIFREVDFTDFHFTRHMLQSLRRVSPEKFALLADELRAAWLVRMGALLPRLGPRVVLLWLAPNPAQDDAEPMLVDADMVMALRPHVAASVTVTFSAEACAAGTAGMVFPSLAEPAARGMPGPLHHAEIAAALAPVLGPLFARA
ncbi:DUF6473 family protein [Paragemmobacter straminiformis]|uniref:DUF6473 domain-containing protein n=1 Tax=Paragemmobacter straminiformis TaxID=2045119 RepID=A0A842IDH4_9RHOB|nr:DUF6473 family protein [Gemmobacter straminiformis]MBC2837569.1 hypothetical protein [Gemmobacter straminiformis]